MASLWKLGKKSAARCRITVAMMFIVGSLLTLGVFTLTWQSALNKYREKFKFDASIRTGLIVDCLDAQLRDLDALKRFIEDKSHLDRSSFRAFVKPMLSRHGIQAIEWVPEVSLERRASVESASEHEGISNYRITERSSDGSLVPAAKRNIYYPVQYVEPLQGNEKAVGFDLGSTPQRIESIRTSINSGRPQVTSSITLVQEKGKQSGFLLFIPIWNSGTFRGFATEVIRAGDFLEHAVKETASINLDTTLSDLSAPEANSILSKWSINNKFSDIGTLNPISLFFPHLTFNRTVKFAGRIWNINIATTSDYRSEFSSILFLAILPAGLLLTLILAIYLNGVLTHRERAEIQVRERTAHLTQANGALEQEAAERRITQEKLEILNQRFQLAVASGSLGIWDRDVSTGELSWNDRMFEMYGLDPGLFSGNIEDFQKSIYPEDLHRVKAALQAAITGKQDYSIEFRIVYSDRTIKTIKANGIVIRDAHGKAIRMIGLNSDVTERRQVEEALKESEHFLKESQTIAGLGSFVYDVSYGVWKSSKVLDKVFGIDEDYERSVEGWVALIHPEDRKELDVFFRKEFFINGHKFDKEYRIISHMDQTVRWVHGLGKPEIDEQGRFLKMFGTVQDITERKQTEIYGRMNREILQILNESGTLQDSVRRILSELKTWTGFSAVGIRLQSGEDFPYFVQDGFPYEFLLTENTLIKRTTDGGICLGKNGKVSLKCFCGLVISGNIGSSSTNFTSGGSFWTNDSIHFLNLPSDGEPSFHPRNRCTHDGYASFAMVPIRNNERIVGLIQFNDQRKGYLTLHMVELLENIASHIGEAIMRKWAEEEIQKKDAEMEQFIYTVSHDLRSPLVTVKTFMGYLEKDMAEGNREHLYEDIQYIHGAADKMKLLLDELLEMSRIGRVETIPVNISLKDVVTETLDTMAGIISERRVDIQLPERDLMLFGDRAHLCQIWQNLIENSIKYSRDDCIPKIALGVQQVGGETVFFVKDNGIGISPKYYNKVFGIFDKLNPKSPGAGLGLSMIQRIIEKCGGRIWVESEGIGNGSCFFFTLPNATIQN